MSTMLEPFEDVSFIFYSWMILNAFDYHGFLHLVSDDDQFSDK